MARSTASIAALPANAGAYAFHRRYREAAERMAALASPEDTAALLPAEPHDEVRDFFYAHHDHFGDLDTEAERTAESLGLDTAGRTADALTDRLAERHHIKVVQAAPERSADARRFDPGSGLLLLSPWLSDGQRAFQLATQLALLEHAPLLDALVTGGELGSSQSAGPARIGLANCFAGALLMPYTAFHQAVEDLHYDIELLQARFGVGFETVCHRLSTLQRTGHRGVPFSFLRVDRAGNISKRQSVTDFHFSRLGGTCPLWTVYEVFSAPGRILTQVAECPTASGTSGWRGPSPGVASDTVHHAPTSPSHWAANSGTPHAWCTRRAPHSTIRARPRRSDWAAASANARTAPSGPGPRPEECRPSIPTGAAMCRTR